MKKIWMMQLIFIITFVQVSLPADGSKEIDGGLSVSVSSCDSVAGIIGPDTTLVVATGTIQAAIDADRAIDDPNTIIFLAKKLYRENVVIDKSLQVIGRGADKTTVSGDTNGDGIGEGSVFTIQPGNIVTLKGMTIQDGDASADYGGGILNDGTLTVDHCDINHNNARYGGGIYNDGVMTIDKSNINGNKALSYGGGIYNDDGVMTIDSSNINDNIARLGGGIYNSFYSDMTIDSSNINGNKALSYGGGIYNSFYSDMTIDSSNINGNKADYGGGIYNDDDMTIDSSNVNGNQADYGGGIYSVTYGASLAVLNSNIMQNIADKLGGGIYWRDNSGTNPTLTNDNIAENIPDQVYPEI
jgi:hypothetical protein